MAESRVLEARQIWQEALGLPGQPSLLHSLAAELAEYTDQSVDAVLAAMPGAKEKFAERWKSELPDKVGTKGLASFYNRDLLEAYELSYWHGGGLGELPTSYAGAALSLKTMGARTVLDYGSGIGSGAIVLSHMGLQTDIADVSEPLLAYASWRLRKRGRSFTAYNLLNTPPPLRSYDAICCFDVLEHTENPKEVIDRLARALRPGGSILCNFVGDDGTGGHPMHIHAFKNAVDFVLTTGVYFNWQATKALADYGCSASVLQQGALTALFNKLKRAYLRLCRRGWPTKGFRGCDDKAPSK
jgi:2-polyprenyl-3-methyl-5-hydroxy-6-metoxy-1,4-benzoquinol methylase